MSVPVWRPIAGALVAAAVLVGCGAVGGKCEYDETSGEVEVTSIDQTAADAGACSEVAYTWVSGGPSKYPAYDRIRLTGDCVTSNQLAVGSRFSVRREDIRQGTCTPSIHHVLDQNIESCRCD